MHVQLFDAADTALMDAAIALRIAVFVDEQGVPSDEEVDRYDRPGAPSVHAIIRRAGRPVATGRFYLREDGAAQIGRMAVARNARRQGLGRALLRALLQAARDRGCTRAVLWAQAHAEAFYASEGFSAEGETFMDAGIPHRVMQRRIV